MRSLFNVLILIFFVFYNLKGYTQNIHLKSKFEKIEIKEDSSFVNEITVLFKKSDTPRFYPIFYDTELEQVSDIQIFVKKGRRLKKLPIKKIYEEDVKLDYITSKKIKSVMIPADMDVQLTYIVSCKELMYFSRLPLFSYDQIDTLEYQINVPNKFKLVQNTIYKDSLSFYTIDSTKTSKSSLWNIKVNPKKVEPDPLQIFGIYKNIKAPLMRTLVMPSAYEYQPKNYMNDWYYKSITPKKGLNASVVKKLDELTKDVNDPMQLVNIIYSYVKSNFKYVAIEIGMGAFIPSHVNEVFLNKQGDCKDLSNFLSEALKYKGIESDIALAATFDHISDCDFPSLSSANHVICIAYINGKTVLLDPTDPIHIEGTPVQSLQDRSILIINSKGGSFFEVEPFSPQQNEIYYEMDLKIGTNIEGTFNINYNGISGNYLRRILMNENEKDFKNYGQLHYEEIFGNQSISNLNVVSDMKKLHLEGDISINGKSFNDGSNKYLFLDFLPRLIETEDRETLIEGTYLRNPFHKKVYTKIKLDEPVEAFDTIEHIFEGDGISLNVKIRAVSNMVIECNYDFIFNHIFIKKENINKTNEILQSFKKIINEPIVLKKQKS